MDLRPYISEKDAGRIIAGRWLRKHQKLSLCFVIVPATISLVLIIIDATLQYYHFTDSNMGITAPAAGFGIIAIICGLTMLLKDDRFERRAMKIYKENGTLIEP